MNLKDMDIVYIVKAAEINEELRYSIRSVAANVPHRSIVIAGYCPKWLKNVSIVPVNQNFGNKYKNAEANWQAAMNSQKVSDDFVLMNDDFFVMRPIKTIEPAHRGDLSDVIEYYSKKPTAYLENMEQTRRVLNRLEFKDLKSYALHIPMVMNKERRQLLYAIINLVNYENRDTQMRTLYGNFWRIGGKKMDDVKAYKRNMDFDPKSLYLSSADDSFKYGKIGEHIRAAFPNKCRYEV